MSEPSSVPDVVALEKRILELEAENVRLSEEKGDPEPQTPASAPRPAGLRWRSFGSALCIVIASILVPASIVSAWAQVQLVDEESFVRTLGPLAEETVVQDLVIDEAMAAIDAQVDFTRFTDDLFDGISELGLPPAASSALDLLRQPAAQGLQGLVDQTLTTVVRSDAFADVWTMTLRSTHRALTVASTSDGGGVVVMTKDGLGIQIGTIVAQVRQELADRGVGVASLIPAVDRVVTIGSGDVLAIVRLSYAIATVAGWWLPILTLALFALGIIVSRRRNAAVLGTGLGFALGGGSLAIALTAGATGVALVAGQLDLSPSALDVIYQRIVADMTQTAWVIALLGVVVAVIGWIMGRSTPARRIRIAGESMNASARARLASWGLDTGAFGRWLARNRLLVRVIIAVIAVLWLFALRPLGAGEVFLVLIVSLLAGWILELLQAPPVAARA